MLTRSSIALPGYQLTERLYTGSRTLVCRAVRDADQQPVVIKLLKNEHPRFSELVQFRNQYILSKNLEISGIVKPYSLEPYGNSYALIMEDFGGSSLRHFAKGRSLPLEQFWSIALQLTEILHPLHQQRVIHKDIKPANILIQLETQQVKLIDFSISSLLPRETQEIKPLNGLEGTLAYLSPEQTGRMNRGVDYRSDFYSLGVTFYELLTGRLPFQSSDPMEMVHCHLAELPLPVCTLNTNIPLMLGEIVHKLMAKNAEDRYQSALGLKHDLVTCRIRWQTTGSVSEFELGQRDLCDRFLIPEKLYGREPEVEALLKAFGRVAEGAAELMLIAGFSGIGKTAVVNEVHKPLVRQRGYFIKGKYDQFNRNIPLSAFVQALRDLMGKLLCESDAQLVQWQDRILEALGESGQVLIEVIPELERIIGNQPSAPELSGSAAQNRFNRLFQKFIGVFTTPEHPLVMFLDDLQWADSASLNLMQVLMNQSEVSYLLLIGAYRDNEVSPAHPLMLTLGEIEKAAIVNTLTLAPLSQIDVNGLIAETLSCSAALASPLTELIYLKAKGNPFFTTQFLKALYEDSLIYFDWDASFWQCDVSQVRSLSLTDDVVEFMALQLQKLSEATQTVLKLAACIGNQFDLATLAIVSEQPETDVAAALWKALQEGLILPQSEVYKFYIEPTQSDHNSQLATRSSELRYQFLHDRVQQAAYSLIPDDEKQVTHWAIGKLLLSNFLETKQQEKIFDIVNHLNLGLSLITTLGERYQCAQLNLMAGQKAKTATAYSAAAKYFAMGIELLPEGSWESDYDLTLILFTKAAEAAYLNANFEQFEALSATILQQAKTLLDKVKVYELQIQVALAQNHLLEAVQIALKVLKFLDINFPEHPTEQHGAQALAATTSLLAGRKPLDLMALPQMHDADKLAAMRILVAVNPCAYVAAPALSPLLILKQVTLSIQSGNAPSSAFGYASYGLVLCGIVGDINMGHQFGQLALQLFDQFNIEELKARTHGQTYGLIWHWKEPVRSTWRPLRDAYQSGLDTGDLSWASIAACIYIQQTFFGGKALTDLSGEVAAISTQLAQIKQESLLNQVKIFQQLLLNLIESPILPQEFTGEVFNAAQMLPVLEQSNDQIALCYFYIAKLFLSYLFEDLETAIAATVTNETYVGAASGLFVVVIFYTYSSLAHLALYAQVAAVEQHKILERVAANQKKLKIWADHAPMNHLHKFYLVEAERCRVLGQKAAAIDLYDRAILEAKENEYLQEEAIANELAAKFYLEWGKERIAQEYLIEAYYGYARWGAKAKIVDLETRYPQLLAPILQQNRSSISVNETVFAATISTSATSSSSSISDAFDLAAILKASQTLSSEIELGKLLSTLLQLIIENAGADKCVLMLMHDDSLDSTRGERLLVKGLTTIGTEPVVLQRIPVEESQDIPLKLIYSVKNRLEPVVLMDATTRTEWITDPYFGRQQPQSILCSPILHQGKLLGIVYLENNLTIGAFTNSRVHILNLLCAQATISLENARLYEQVQQALDDAKLMQFSIDRIITPVCWVEPDARISYANDAFCLDIGYSREEIFDKYVYDFNPDFSKEGWADHWRSIQQHGSATFESRTCNREGICHPVEVTINHIMFHGQEYHLTFIVDISERKRAEKSLKLTQFAVNYASLPIWQVKPDGQISYVNDAACRDSGYSQAEMVGKYVWDFNPDLSLETWGKDWQELKERGSFIFEAININKSGNRYPVEVTLNYFELDGEEYHFAFITNICDRKQAEQEQARLLAILEATTDIIGIADINGNSTYLNRAGQQILQIPAEETNQFNISQAIAASMLEVMETEILPKAMREGIWSGELLLCSRSGEEIPVSQVLMTHKNAQGEIEFISTIMRDIREAKREEAVRKRIEATSKAFQERLTFLIQQTPLAVIEWNLEFKVVGWNPSAEKIFGYRAEEMLAQHATQIVPASARTHVAEVMQGQIFEQSGRHSLNQNICKDGSLITCEWINTPLLNAEGHPMGVFSIVQDVSDRKAAELAIQQKTEALEHALQELQQAQLQIVQSEKMSALGNLVAGVAHEINNPIGFISGNLQPALDYVRDTFGLLDLYQQEYPHPNTAIQNEIEAIDLEYVRQDLPRLIGSMKLGVDRIRGISTSLRTFSRADKDYKVYFNIHEGIDSTILILKHRLKADSNRPEIEVDTDYGTIPIIECFPGQLNQVFMNILANAIDTLEEATQKLTFENLAANPNRIEIQTQLDAFGKQVIIHIRDNGMGMSDAVKQRVFDHLFTTKAVGKGTGLGLAIAHQIVVEKHGGAIAINSTLGVGTEFVLTLPVKANG